MMSLVMKEKVSESVLNNLIILLCILVIGLLLLKQRYAAAIVWILCFAFMGPVLILGDHRINSLYVLTLLLLIEALVYRLRGQRQAPFGKLTKLYLVTMGVAVLAYTIGFLLAGTAAWRAFIVAMIGYLQTFLVTFLIFLLLRRLPHKHILHCFWQSIAVTAVINFAFALLQRYAYQLAYPLTRALYLSDGRTKPLNEVGKIDYFDRIFGTFYSPTVLGLLIVLILAFIVGYWLKSLPGSSATALLLIVALLLHIAIIAYTKIVMLGMPLLLLYWVLLCLVLKQERKLSYQRLDILTAVTIAVYVLTWFSIPEISHNARDYYYSLLLKPLGSLDSRYAAISPPSGHTGQMEHALNSGGITADAFAVFFQHPVFGVGPLPIVQEFIGDSQLIQVLHNGGIVAGLSYVVFYLCSFLDDWKKRNPIVLSLVPAIFVGCIAAVALDSRQSLLFIAYLLLAGEVHESWPDEEIHLWQPLLITDEV